MGRRVDLDRYLKRRGHSWTYNRRVPTVLLGLDNRGPVIRQALGTRDLAIARKARDLLEAADDERWGALMAGTAGDDTSARYAAAVRLASALGYGYRPAAEIANEASWAELANRMERILPDGTSTATVQAVLGTVEAPMARFSDAFKVYCEEIYRAELAKKSPQQLRKWRVIPERAIRTFVDVVGDKPLEEITRADAVTFYKFWLEKISPGATGAKRWSPSSGNRQIGELRKLYREYFNHVHNQPERLNPFRALSFKEGTKNKRPAFSDSWIQSRFCAGDKLNGLNDEARAILLAMVETGARPSELCNLTEQAIRVDAEVPHLAIEERLDPEAPRELKSGSSKRFIPLVGVSLEVFKTFREGFPRYWEREEDLSATINKYLSKNGLRETPKHSLYSLRHSFEDRMLRADFDESLRIALFGHKSERPVYGDAGGLKWKRDQLLKIAFPFQVKDFKQQPQHTER